MRKILFFVFAFLFLSTILEASEYKTKSLSFIPIEHASFIIRGDDLTVFVDPVGDVSNYAKYRTVDIILITDVHHDHLDKDLVRLLRRPYTQIIGPKSVIDELGFGTVMNNDAIKNVKNVYVKAMPMYNLTEERLMFHAKGRGNGYLLRIADDAIYIAGDTEDIPEMRSLRDVDYAFICMNLPYTMTVEQATSAVLEFKPKVVFPYHYRGKKGFSDIKKFKQVVENNSDIKVELLEWY